MAQAIELAPRDKGSRSAEQDPLRVIAERRFDASISAATEFFESNADGISSASLEIARRFHRGGRLFVFGEGADATDAQHVAVEFVHPVIVGKRALPAIALTNDVASITSRESAGDNTAFAAMLGTLGRAGDIALAISNQRKAGGTSRVGVALHKARSLGMLTVAIQSGGKASATNSDAMHLFLLPPEDVLVAQEVGETLYHVFWELVHLFLEHGVGEIGDNETVGVSG